MMAASSNIYYSTFLYSIYTVTPVPPAPGPRPRAKRNSTICSAIIHNMNISITQPFRVSKELFRRTFAKRVLLFHVFPF